MGKAFCLHTLCLMHTVLFYGCLSLATTATEPLTDIFFFERSFQLSGSSFSHQQPLQVLAKQTSSNQHPHVLQLRQFFGQEWNNVFTKNLCKCTETPSTLSINNCKKRNLYLSGRSELLTSFRLKMNVGVPFKHQNNTSFADSYKEYFHS